MRKWFAALCLPLLLAAGPADAGTLAITNARVVTMTDEGTLDSATIIVRDGRIEAVGSSQDLPQDARVIDAEGKLVTPGLMNSLTRLGLVEVSNAQDTVDHAQGAQGYAIAFDVQYGINPNSMLIPIVRAEGLTRAITAPSSQTGTPFLGFGAGLRLVAGVDILDQPKVALFATVGGSTTGEGSQSRSAEWQMIRRAFDEARDFGKPFRFFRSRPGHDQFLRNIDLEALQPVLEGEIPLAIFVHRESDIRQAVKLADDYGLRLILLGAAEAWRAADLLAAKKIPVVIDPFDNLPMSFDEMGARLDNAAILHAAGVVIAFFDSGINMTHHAGASLREGAGIAVANGLPWEAALAAMTRNAAAIWGASSHGSIWAGQAADLVIWDGDPLEVMSAPTQVIVGGEPVSLRTRETELRDRYHPKHRDSKLPPAYR